MVTISRIIFLILFTTKIAGAQVNRYIVLFKDKVGTPYAIGNPSSFLSAKAIQRRTTQNIPVTETDLPVVPSYVSDIRNAGATVLYTTRWMNGVLIECNAALIPALEALTHVQAVELVAPGARPVNGGRKRSMKSKLDTDADETTPQNAMIGIDQMHSDGFRGEGVSIAVFDGGFLGANTSLPFQHVFDENRFESSISHDFVYGGSNVFRHDDHGTQVWSVLGAFQNGTFTGGAYKANFQLYVTEDVETEYRIEEYNWLIAAERADSAGVDIINSSLGYNTFDSPAMNYSPDDMNGSTAVVSRAAQLAASRGILVVSSAGNEGAKPWRIVTAPADAANVLAIGNVNANGVKSPSSSFGPSADGRIKPDLVALGTSVKVIRANGTVGSASGTLLSAPLVASLAAGIRQKFPHHTGQQLVQALRLSSSQANSPDNSTGYGIPAYRAASDYLEFSDEPAVIRVFPNPVVNDTLILASANPAETATVYYSITTSTGQLAREGNLTFSWANSSYAITLTGYQPGLYFLRIRVNGKWHSFKIIKV